MCSEDSNSANLRLLYILSETAAALLERSAVAPPVESKYIVKSRIIVASLTLYNTITI